MTRRLGNQDLGILDTDIPLHITRERLSLITLYIDEQSRHIIAL